MHPIYRFISFSFLLLLFSLSSQAQNWQSLTNANQARWIAGGILLEDKFYVISGFEEVNRRELIVPALEVYDIPNDSWTSLTPMPLSKYETDPGNAGVTHTAYVLLGDTIWVVGGRTGDHPGKETEEVWLYDTQTDSWSAGPDLPIGLANGYCVKIGRNLHYIAGFFNGCNGMSYKQYTLDVDAWLSDPVNVSWDDHRAPLPEGRAHVSVAALGGKIYVFGGEPNHDCCYGAPDDPPCRVDLKDAFVYDVETDSWSNLPDLPYGRSHSETNTFAMDGKIYQVGSEVGSTTSKTTLVYDPSNNSWSEESSWEFTGTIHVPSACVYKDSLILTHGGIPNKSAASTNAQYTLINRSPVYDLGWGKDTVEYWVYEGLSAKQEVLAWTLSGKLTANLAPEIPTSWINTAPTVDVGLDGAYVPIEVNSQGLSSGTYYSNLIINGIGWDVVDYSLSVPFNPDTIVVKLVVGPSPDGVLLMEQSSICEGVEVGNSQSIAVDIFTPGATSISLNSSSNTNASFSLTGALPSSISGLGEETCNILFTPTAPGIYNSTFTINHSGGAGSSQVMLSCEAIPPCVDPPNWIDTTLGSPAIAGSACVTGDTYRMSAGGSNIWSRADEGRFFSTKVTGDGDMIIKVNWVTEEDEDTKIGIMFRESLDEDAANAFLRINPNNYLSIQYRPAAGQGTYREIAIGYFPPHWLKLERQGNIITPYESEDGINWTVFNNSNIPITLNLPDTLYAGIAFTSKNASAEAFAEVEGVSVNFNPVIFPVVLESFEASLQGRFVRLDWKVGLEENFSHYEIERKTASSNEFISIGRIYAQGNASYDTWDKEPQAGKNLYRLAMHDIDGKVAYSNVREIEVGLFQSFEVRALHDRKSLELLWHDEDSDSQINLIDITGKQIWTHKDAYLKGSRNIIPLPGLSEGYYVIEVKWRGLSQRKLILIK